MTAPPGPFSARELAPRAPRTVTMLVVAKLLTGAGEGLCRIRNMSTGGLVLETRMGLAPDEAVRIELRSGRALTGRVVWCEAPRAGLAFDAPVVVEEALATPVPAGSRIARAPHPRAPRIAAEARIEVHLPAGRIYAHLCDISQGGARLKLPVTVRPGDRMTLSVPGIAPKLAFARWAGEDVGVVFAEPLSFDALAGWLAARPQG